MHFFCLIEVRAMVVAVQQPSAECNTMTMKMTIHKTCTCVCSTFPVPVAIFMYLLLAFPVLQTHGTKECYKGGSQAAALLKYIIMIIQVLVTALPTRYTYFVLNGFSVVVSQCLHQRVYLVTTQQHKFNNKKIMFFELAGSHFLVLCFAFWSYNNVNNISFEWNDFFHGINLSTGLS